MAAATLVSRAVGRPLLELTFGLSLTDFTAAATSESVALGSIPAYAVVEKVALETMEAAAHPTASAVAVEVGITADPDAYVTSTSILATGRTSTGGAGTTTPTAAVPLLAKVTADANLGDGTDSSFTAGLIAVRVWYRVHPLLTA